MDVLELGDRRYLHPEVIHARALHGCVVGDDEDELPRTVGEEDQRREIARRVRHVLPPEDLAEEVGDLPSPCGVEHLLARDAHRDVVEATGRFPHHAPGATRTFAAVCPAARSSIAGMMLARGTGPGAMSASTGSAPEPSSRSASSKPVAS